MLMEERIVYMNIFYVLVTEARSLIRKFLVTRSVGRLKMGKLTAGFPSVELC